LHQFKIARPTRQPGGKNKQAKKKTKLPVHVVWTSNITNI
jgi:hypothetical protein